MKSLYLITSFLCGMVPVLVTGKTIGLEAQTDLNITIYNENRALVNDTRTVTLNAGRNALAFANVSAQIMPQSALLQGQNIRLLEQNFNYDLLSENALLEKAVGTSVLVEYINPATGEVSTKNAELLAVNGVNPILKINGKIETQYPGRIIFNKVPANLWAKPTLVMDVESKTTQTSPIHLSYLTGGLSWKADYVAELNEAENHLTLRGLVTLTNNSGTDYKQAHLQLVAGDVNLVSEYVQPTRLMMKNAAIMDMAGAAPAVAPLSDFYLYTLPRQTDILSNQTKQVSLLDGDDITAVKTYEFNNTLDMTYTPQIKKVNPEVFVHFENTRENGLGIALPKGIIRLYKADATGKMLFVGEDSINHTAPLETVRLKMGQAFDVFAAGKRTSYTKTADKTYEAAYEITITNGSDKPVQVSLYQSIPGTWKILSESAPHTAENSNRLKWVLDIPAQDKTLFTYQVQVKHD